MPWPFRQRVIMVNKLMLARRLYAAAHQCSIDEVEMTDAGLQEILKELRPLSITKEK